MKSKIIVSLFFSSCIATTGFAAAKGGVPWDYNTGDGPTTWGSLSPDYAMCASGKSQSPINIPSKVTVAHQNSLQFNYRNAPLMIVYDGLAKLKIGKQSLTINDGHTIQLNFNSDANESLQLNGETYQLMQFHFHTPSENELHGQVYPAEIHFVNQGPDGKVAVIGVFIKSGKANPMLQRILNNIPQTAGQVDQIQKLTINPSDLLPANKSNYSFMGSLTTPPCNEGLQWFVMANPIEASPQQIEQLHNAIHEDNVRPVQPLNGRKVIFNAS